MAVVENTANANANGGAAGVDLGIIINSSTSSSSSSLGHPSFPPNSNVSSFSSSYYNINLHNHHHHHHHHHQNNNHNRYYYNHAAVDSSSSSPPHTLQQRIRMFVSPTSSPTPTHQHNMTHQLQLHNNNNINIVGGGGGACNPNSGFVHHHHRSNSSTSSSSSSATATDFQRNTTNAAEGFQRQRNIIKQEQQLLSKLNPMAQEFVPHSLSNQNHPSPSASPLFYAANNFLNSNTNSNTTIPSFDFDFDIDIAIAAAAAAAGANNFNNNNNTMVLPVLHNMFTSYHGKPKAISRTYLAQRQEVIKRTVKVSDIDQQVTENQLAALFVKFGEIVDCRICGDPSSVLRFAFIEFTHEDAAKAALGLAGTMVGCYPVRVLPSKSAIAPVDPKYLPGSEDEHEMTSRTIYCTNIDKKISQADVKTFFESLCGTVYRLRLLGDYHHSTRIAFVEFVLAESAILALNCSGVVLGSLPIRVSPSKTPVRPRTPRPQMHFLPSPQTY